jgi:hypothetical protein
MNSIFKLIGILLFAHSMAVQAIPTLFFDGDISYSAGQLNVNAQLTGTDGIAPLPETVNSSLDFTALLASVDTSFAGLTIGYFATNPGSDDLTVIDGNANLLLTGNFSDLAVFGANGNNAGNVYGFLTATGGSLATSFGVGNLVALQLNLDTAYSSTMFDSTSSWSGNIDGNIQGEPVDVPEPGVINMLGFGLLLLGLTYLTGWNNQQDNKNKATDTAD